jgi:putrescine transport system permease protein
MSALRRLARLDVSLTMLALGYAFLYIPILLVMVYSFNDSRLVTVWGGLSLRWYGELFRNDDVLAAAWLSLRVALLSATVATALGTLAGLALARAGRFRGRVLFSGMIAAPLVMVMPEVITGLSLLLLFVSLRTLIGWPETRGATTIAISHITFCMAYVAVIVQSRLAGMDESLEEAAMDLGGRPFRVLFDITLPLIAPAMVSGWLLSFTLSVDDLVISSFVSGPGATTLPMLIFSKVRLGVTPDINALATLMILVVTVAVAIAGWLMLREERQRVRAIQAAARG